MVRRLLLVTGGLLFLSMCANAQPSRTSDLLKMSIEDLMQVEVYSVSKRTQKVGDVAASVFVLHADDIKRSGASSIPEALRMVPGVDVAQINAHSWAVSIRGSNSQFANKLQVLVDGQSVYSFAFSGVFWNDIEIPLEEVERIEIQRGPGGAIWGANAVNGVINIITKKASSTPGTYVSVGGGNIKESLAHVAQGFNIGQIGYGRVYAKESRMADSSLPGGQDAFDGTTNLSGGIRADLSLGKDDKLSIKGDSHSAHYDLETLNGPGISPGTLPRKSITNTSRIITKWAHEVSVTDEFALQLDYINENRDYADISEFTDTYNSEAQYNLAINSSQNLILGAGVRAIYDDSIDGEIIRYRPTSRDLTIPSLFAQHEARFLEDQLILTTGLRIERNPFTKVEYQPSVRILGRPTKGQSIWGAFSRAVRTPSRAASDVRFVSGIVPLPEPYESGVLEIQGNDNAISEGLNAFEAGYRTSLTKEISLDLSGYYFRYDSLSTIALTGAPEVDADLGYQRIVIPLNVANEGAGHATGGDLSLRYNPLPWWRNAIGYAYFHSGEIYDHNTQQLFVDIGNNTPSHSVLFRSGVTLLGEYDLDATLRHLSGVSANNIDAYFQLDLTLRVPLSKQLAFSLIGQNLLHESRDEYHSVPPMPVAAPSQRGVFGKLTWEFE